MRSISLAPTPAKSGRLAATALAVSLAVFATACSRRPEPAPAPEPPPVAAPAPSVEPGFAPAMWKVTDADSTVYLFGTIHLRSGGKDWGTPVIKAALAEATEVWTEIEIDPSKEAAMTPLVMELGSSETPLSSRLTAEQLELLRTTAGSVGLQMAQLDTMQPWFAALNLSVMAMMKAGFSPVSGVDRFVDAAGEADGDTMRWFESAEQQLRFFADMPEEAQVSMLVDTLTEFHKGVQVIRDLEVAWATGNVEALTGFLADEMQSETPELYDLLIVKRNAAWVETLAAELAGSGVDFVAVGAGHLVGPDAVQVGLAARGFTVERVSTAP